MSLAMKPACQRCNAKLPQDAGDAYICSHECTFCRSCAAQMAERCPNCGGELRRRPRRMPSPPGGGALA